MSWKRKKLRKGRNTYYSLSKKLRQEKRSNDEFAIVGTHMFSQPAVTIQTNSIEQTIESELNESTPDGQAKLLIFSDTEWAGAYQSSNIEVMEISGQNDDDILFECNSSLGRQALFGAKIQKLTQDGYLELYVIQNQKIILKIIKLIK